MNPPSLLSRAGFLRTAITTALVAPAVRLLGKTAESTPAKGLAIIERIEEEVRIATQYNDLRFRTFGSVIDEHWNWLLMYKVALGRRELAELTAHVSRPDGQPVTVINRDDEHMRYHLLWSPPTATACYEYIDAR